FFRLRSRWLWFESKRMRTAFWHRVWACLVHGAREKPRLESRTLQVSFVYGSFSPPGTFVKSKTCCQMRVQFKSSSGAVESSSLTSSSSICSPAISTGCSSFCGAARLWMDHFRWGRQNSRCSSDFSVLVRFRPVLDVRRNCRHGRLQRLLRVAGKENDHKKHNYHYCSHRQRVGGPAAT